MKSIVMWVAYVMATLFYIISFDGIPVIYSKLIFYLSSFIIMLYCMREILKGFMNYVHRAFVVACLSAVALNFLLIIFHYVFGMDNYKLQFCSFLFIELLTACFLLISGKRHGLFKNETSMR